MVITGKGQDSGQLQLWALNKSSQGNALCIIEAWVRKQGTPELANSYAFLGTRFKRVFMDLQAKEQAQRKLEAFCQRSKVVLEALTA
jgi:hypothetical protein